MNEHLGSFTQNPSQKFYKNFINFEKPQKFNKNPKVRSKSEMHDEWMKKRHTRSKKCSLRLKNTWVEGLECEREVWEDEKMKTIERDWGELKKNHADPIYKKVIKLDRLRGVEI